MKLRKMHSLVVLAVYVGALVLAVLTPPMVAFAAPVPTVTLSAPSEVFIGENFSFTATFSNTDLTAPGYGPYIDLIFPFNGADGNAGADTPDGIDFVSAEYLGVALNTTVLTFPDDGGGSGCVQHPYAVDNTGTPVDVCGTAGDKLVVVEMPFGSFTNDQPPAPVTINATLSNLADLNVPLTIQARGGFRYGADPLDNPSTDPSIIGSWASSNVTPILIRLTKEYSGPEDETATGPNYPRQYTITVDIASGQTVTDLDVIDELPNNMAFLSLDATSPGGASTIDTPTVGAAANPPDNDLIVRFASVTGGAGSSDATVTFSYFIPEFDANGAAILGYGAGEDDVISENQARAVGDWTPVDTRDAGGTDNAVADPVGVEHTLNDRPIAIQKSVTIVNDTGASGPSPGDTLEYTLEFQVSDYRTFGDIVVTDVMGDGQDFDNTFTPTLQTSDRGGSVSGSFIMGTDAVLDTSQQTTCGNGTSTLTFDVSSAMVRLGDDGILQGGRAIAPDAGAATGTITFRTTILENYYCVAGDVSVDHGDHIDNNVTIAATERDNANIGTTVGNETEVSAASVTIVHGELTKVIYARNGNTADTGPDFAPGDTITYRITYTLPTSDTEDLYFDDYLPLPVLYATEVTTFDAVVSATTPAAGHAKFGPDDTFYNLSGIVPTISSDATANRLRFTYGTYDGGNDTSTEIDILFTVTVSDDPFADGLYLTNQVRVYENNTFGDTSIEDKIIQFRLTEPQLTITKGVVATDNPAGVFNPATVGPVSFGTPPGGGCPTFGGTINSNGLAATPVDSDLSNVDASDWVRFAVVVENTGSGLYGAFDVNVRDVLPSGFDPASVTNFCVTDGAGNPLSYTGTQSDFFGAAGITLDDDNVSTPNQGALTAYDATSGSNILVITYDAQLQTSVGPGDSFTTDATVANYAGAEGAANHVPGGISDPATVTVTGQQLDKSIVTTNKSYTSGNDVAIGEQVQYRLVATIPEGTVAPMQIVDTLDAGLAFVRCDNITASAGLSTDLAGGFAAACDNVNGPNVTDNGHTVTFDLGTVTNSDTDNNTTETITIDYTVVVLNVSGNQRGTLLNNSATWGSATASAPDVTVVEPTLTVAVDATPNSGDAGDVITITIDVAHDGTSNMDAQDVALTDAIPAGTTYVAGSLSSSGAPMATLAEAGGTITGTWDDLPLGQSTQITFQVTLNSDVHPRDVITDTADITWQSLDDDPGQISTYNTNSTERTGADGVGGALNDYAATASDSVTVNDPALAKALTATNKGYTTDPEVAIGEVVTYTVTVTVPEGQMSNAEVVDQLDAGLAFVACDSITPSNPAELTTDVVGDFAAVCSNPTVGTDGQSVTYNFGTLTNANTDNGVAETLTIVYRAVVLNVIGNQRGVTLENSASLNWEDSSGTPQGIGPVTTSVTVVEPEMTVAVSPSSTTGDAGDTITYTVTVSNPTGPNDMDAQDVHLEDLVPAGMTYVPGTWAHTSGVAPTAISEASAPTLTADWDSFSIGGTSTFTFDATIDYTNTPGQTLTDTATLTWQSLDDDPGQISTYNANSTERTGADGLLNSGALNDYQVQASADVTVNNVQPVKSIVSTSEAITGTVGGTEQVVIGEIVRYRAEVQIPEGSSPNFQIVDLLPTGLQFLDDGTAMVAFVANTSGAGAGVESSTLGTGPQQVGDETTLSSITPTYVLPGTAISGGASSGDDVTFSLGDLTNNDSDANQEFVVLEFNALVLNETGNQSGDTLTNQYEVYIGGSATPNATSNTVDVIVGEPSASLGMALTTTPTDAGDTVVYTLTVSNDTLANDPNVTPAMDSRVLDVLDTTNLTLQSVSVTAPSGYTDNSNTGTNTVDVTIDRLNPGESATITVTAQVNAGAAAGVTVNNTADLNYTSLPGTGTAGNPTGSTTPGASGAANGERNGDDGIGGLNDYADDAQASFRLATPTIHKVQPVPDVYPIGAPVDYDIVVTLPEGVTQNLRVEDFLPPGIAYDNSYQIITTAAASGGLLTNDFAGSVPAPTVTSGGLSGDDVLFTFGDTTTTDDNDANNNAFVIRFTGRILNEAGNQAGTVLPSNADLYYDDATNGDSTVNGETVQVTVIEPVLTVNMTPATATGDAGDEITFTVTVEHDPTSNADAQDVVLDNLVPAGMTYVTGSYTATGGTDAPDTVNENASDLQLIWNTLPNGDSHTFTFRARIDYSANPGDTFTQTADLQWTSVSGDLTSPQNADPSSCERTGDTAGCGGALNDYRAQDTSQVTVTDISMTKSIRTTSEAITGAPSGTEQLVIGEIVRYRAEVELPEGTSPNFQIVDALPDGLRYLDDGTAMVAFVANGGGITSDTLGTAPQQNGNETNVGTIIPSSALPSGAVSGGPFASGTDPTFSLGNLTNNDSDTDSEFVVLEFNAIVVNEAANQEARTLTNQYEVFIGGNSHGNSNTVDVELVEPNADITMSVTTAPTDAGDAVQYTITVTNNGSATAPAMDSRVLDVLDTTNLTLQNVNVAAPSGYTNDSNTGTNTVDVTIDRLNPGESATIVVDATVNATAPAALTVDNTADLTYTSLPGTNGTAGNPTGSTAPNGSGGTYGERNGDDGAGGALNDYAASANAPFTLATPIIEKIQPVPATYPIGAPVTYDIRVTLPEGVTRDLDVLDILPAGVAYDDNLQIITTAAASGGALSNDFAGTVNTTPTVTTVGGSGDDVTFIFGDTTTTDDNDANNNAFLIRFTGRILNEAGNQDGTVLTSDGELHYTNPNNANTETVNANQVQVTVIEPLLDVDVAVDNQMPTFGDTVTYTVTVQHNLSSTADAEDVHLTELIPSGLTYVPGSLQYVSGPTPTLDETGAPTLVADWGSIPQGQVAVITYQATVDGSPPNNIGDVLTDDIDVTWTSISGAEPNERTGADGPGGALNDYAATTNIPVGLYMISATKTDALQVDANSDGQVNPGETIRYTVVVSNSGSVADALNVVYTDTPDANTTLVVGSVTTTAGTVTTGNNAGDTTIQVDVGTLAQNSTVTITFDVTVNQPFPAGLTQVANQGHVAGSNFASVDTDDPDTAGTLGDPTITPVVSAPLIESDKTDALFIDANSDGVFNSGDTIRYTVTITNTGNQNASNVVFTDTPDANTTLVVGSVTTTAGTVTTGNNAGDTSVQVDIGTMLGDDGAGNYDTVTITFDATINATLVPPTTIQVENQGQVSGSNFTAEPTNDPDTAPDDDPTVSPLISAPIIQAQKTDALTNDVNSNGVADGGDTLTYTVTLVNVGAFEAQNVVFNDTPDANTTLVVGSVTTTQGTITSGNAGGDTSVAVAVGTLAANGGSVTITFDVTVNDPIPSGVTEVANQGTASGDNFTDTPTDDPDTTDPDDPTRTPVGVGAPNVQAQKTDALTNDVNSNGLVDAGDTLTYTVTLTNSGTADATNVNFTDTPDANTTLVIGSVATTQGTVTTGNNAGDTSVAVAVGTIPANGGSVTITFQVQVVDPIPAGVTQVANQGTVTGDNIPNTPTDDPDTGTPDDPTVTPLANAPDLSATKTDALSGDANGNGLADAGDTITYTVTLTNNGGADATNVNFTDTPDANTTLVVGSVNTTVGTVTTGNNAGDTSVAVAVGTLAANGGSVTITFDVTVNDPIPSGVTEVANQGTATCDNCAGNVPTDDPDTTDPDDPTRTPVGALPDISATKTDALAVDNNGNGVANPGDVLAYTVVLTNNGTVDAGNVVFNDTPDANTALISGTVTTTQGTITTGNGAGDSSVRVDVGTLTAGGGSVTITFRVRVNDPLPAGTTQVANQGTIACSNCPTDVQTDDPDTAPSGDPTVTPVEIPPDAPELSATKRDELFTDADTDGVPSAGDTLRYVVVITNQGGQTATGATFTDTPDANTTLEVGSVTSTQGIITTGNNAGDTSVAVNIGDIPPNASVTIIFRVVINNPLPPNTLQVQNQGTAACPSCGDDTPTDDPDTPAVDDPTITPLGAIPRLELYKTVALTGDANGNGEVNAGDVLTYTVEVHNYGNGAATNVNFTDTPDANTSMIIGSGTASDPAATVTTDSSGITVDIPTINAGGVVTITFQVRVNDNIAPTVTQVANQGLASCPPCVLGDEPTDDPATPTDDDPTIIPVVPPNAPAPEITVFDPAISKVGELLPGQLGLPGEQLTWTFTITNNGAGAGTNVVITDTLQSELRIDSADIEVGTVTVSGQDVTFNIPVLNPGQTVIAHVYTTVLRSPLEGRFENTAYLTGTDPIGTVQTATDTAIVQGVSGLPATGYPPQAEHGSRLWMWALLALSAAAVLGTTAWQMRRARGQEQPPR